ncbi:MAG: T9SS type A sorting domain-containing protein [Clostridia bacterium]|nr:T9SS type A sorting domain-containing protein [Clostridia bacterium]
MKKNNSITFWLALIIVGWSLSINAQSYSGGGGTQASPYEIANKTDLRYLSEHGSERDSHGKTQVAILTLHKADYCDGSNDTAQRSNKSLLPYADAGSDATIFENQTHQLLGNASNHNSVYWTGGSGSFSDPDINNPVYTPQAGVYGNVSLTFHAVALYPDIEPASDEVIITIQQNIVSNAIVYVNKNVTGGNNDGSSWADAFTYFQDALTLAYANSDVSQIWVAAGVYYPDEGASQTDNNHSATFSLVEGVKLYGGFNGTETELSQRNIATNPTILSGDIDGNDINTDGNYIAETTADIVGNNSYHVLTADGTGTTNITTATQLNGFIISAGNAYGDEYTDKIGGGLLCNGSDADKIASPSIIQCSFIANSAEYYGGAIYNNGYGGTSSPIISHCCFSANSAGDQGGAICNDGEIFGISSPLFTNCSFSANSAIAGGAIFNDGFIEGISSPVFTNCSFSANSAENNGGAIYSWGSYGISSPVFTNCSFSANSAGNNGGAISNRGEEGTTSPLFTNCILWGNTATSSGSEVYNDEATSNFSFCNIAGSGGSGSGWDSSLGTDDANNMDSNPMFVDVANGDLRIYGMSPCADAGNNAANTKITDIRGGDFGRKLDKNNHTLAGTIDMGAYEYKEGTDPLSPCANPNDGGTIAASQTICSGSVPDSLTSLTLPSGHTGTLEYKWQYSTEGNATGFADIANSNAAGFAPATFTETTWLKRLARVDCMADWSGASESNVVEVTVIPKDDASFSYAAFAFCVNAADPTPTITVPGGTFSSSPAGFSINTSTGTIDVSVSTPGMYTVTYTTAGTCPNSSNVSVNIVTLDDAWFSYAANPFCLSTSDPTPNQIASPGGIFSSSPAGLVINASTGTIDVLASTPGVYDITYTTSGACSNSFTQTMVFVGGPTSDAGQNATICEQQTTYGLDATVFNASYVEWTSSGSGTFSDANFVDAIYTPSSDDVSAGSVELSLTAFPTSPCVAQATNTITITFENTPVSGILTKSPDQFSACDGDDVSATLTPGSGGNGIDSLAYRTHDGSNWSAWIGYNSGDAISTLGKTQIEILTLRKANYCNDASAEIVSWSVEETPVSGTLNKTPDLANVCEGSDVSATITPGNGGNGIDSLAYRTHDGSNWSVWIGYNSGDAISTLGRTQMEILTLRKAEYCNDASAEIVSWAVEETPVSGTLNKTPDLADVCEGSDVSATITPGIGGNGIDSLAYRTHDGSNWSTWIGYNSGDAISTLGKSQVEILTLRKANYCNDASAEIVSWAIHPRPVAVAGIDASIAQSETCTLSDATAENYSSVVWSTSGDGTFNSEASLNPVYTPGNNDIAAGVAHLCLTAIAQSPCVVNSTDCMMLTIYRNPLVEITTPADSSTVYDYALTVLGTASDADGDLTEVYVRLNGGGWQLATGTQNWNIDLLLTGGYQKIEAMAIDVQNLESDLDEINIFVGIQEIDIYQGWSAISSYLIPLDPALEQVMQNVTIPGNLTFMLGQSGMLWPEFDINTIGNWDVYQGYKVKHKQADVLTIFGDKPDDNSMTYPAGLYMIPVLSNTPASISAAFSDPENDVDYIFDVTFGGIYWPQGGIVSLSELIPGMGYIAKFNKAVTLTFPDIKNLKSSATPMVAKNETSSPWAFSRTAEVHLVSIFDDTLNDLGNVSHIGAFDSQGNCIGAANTTQKGSNILLVMYGDDGCTGIKDGAEEGELITFRAYDATTGIATALQPVFSERFANHDGLFTSGGLSAVASFKVGAAGITVFDLPAQIRVYPNPAKDILNLVFDDSNSLDGVSFELINSNGSKVLAQNISERHTKLNISLLQPGVFILKISDKGNSFLRKVIIQ